MKESDRLLSYRFHNTVFAVAAEDQGETLKYVKASAAASAGYVSPEAAWNAIDQNMSNRAKSLEIFGIAPFWFVDCPGWPPSAFLAWSGLTSWAHKTLRSNRTLMAASFSADQLILGFADSPEFHDRLGHAREAPVERPLLAYPFLLRTEAKPAAIAKIDLYLGQEVRLYPEAGTQDPIIYPLIGE